MHVKASVWAWFALFSILLFYSTVCFHFAEQINDDDDDEMAEKYDKLAEIYPKLGKAAKLRSIIRYRRKESGS